MTDNQFIKKPSGFNKQRLDSFIRSVKTNKQDVQKKELDEALALHTQLVAQDMMQRAMQLPAFPDLQQAYINQGMQQLQPMQRIPQAAYGMEIGAVMPSINSPFTYPSQQNLTPPNSDMFKKNADKYEGKGMSAFKNLFTTAANAVLNPAIQEYNQNVYNAKQKAAAKDDDEEVPEAKLGGLIKAQIIGELNGDPWEKQLMRGVSGYSPAPRPPVKQNLVGDVRKAERPTAVASTTSVKSAIPRHWTDEAGNQRTATEIKAIEAELEKARQAEINAEKAKIAERAAADKARLQQVAQEQFGVDISQVDNYNKYDDGTWAPKTEKQKQFEAGIGDLNQTEFAEQNIANRKTTEEELIDLAKELPFALLGTGAYSQAFKMLKGARNAAPAAGAQLFGEAQAFEKVPFKPWESKGLPAKEAIVTESDFWKTADLKKTVEALKKQNKAWDDLYNEYEIIDADLAKRGIKTNGTPNAINNLYPELKVKFDKLVANKPAEINSKTLTTEQEKYLKDLLLPAIIDNTIPYFRASYGPEAFANSISRQDWSPLKSGFQPEGTIEDLILRRTQNKNINDILDANIDISKIKDPLATVNIDGVTYKVGDILDFKNRGSNYELTPRKFFWNQKGGNIPTAKMSGDLPKAQIMGTTGSTFGPGTGKPKEVQDAETALQENLDRYQSDEPVYDNQGNLITKEQLQQAAQDAYNAYYQAVGQAIKDNPTPSMGGPGDMSYMYNYPTRDGLNLPNVNISGPGVMPELYKGIATAQKYTDMGMEYPGLDQYLGLNAQRRLEIDNVNYSPNYKAMYNDALSKGQRDRFQTNIEAAPTAAGRFLDKIGIGKMFDTKNYNITENVLPEGQSIFDPERLAESQRKQTLLANEDMPGGGLFQTDEMDPYIWENRTRRDRRDVLQGAGIDPSRKNLRRLGENYFENLKQDRIREEAEASREGYENTLAAEDAATKRDVSIATIGKRPRNAWDLVGTGVQSVPPAPAVIGPNNAVVPAAVTTAQPNVVTPNPTTSQTSAYTPPAFDLNRTQNQIVKTEGEWFGTKPAGLALPDNYDPNWKNYAVDKSAGQYMYPNANKVKQDWDSVMAKDPKKKALWESFNDMPAPIREIAADQVFNAGYDPRVMVLGAAGVDKGYTGKGSPVTSNPEYRKWLKTNADQLWKDNKDLINQQYADDPQAFTSSITDNRKVIYGNLRTDDLAGGVLTDFPSNSGGPGTQYNAWSGRSGAVQDYVDKTYFDPSTGYTAPQYFKQKGGSQLPMFQIEGEYPGIDWEPFETGPFAKKKGPFFNNDRNKITLGLPEAFPDANKMRTFFDTGEAPLTAEAFSKELDKWVPKYTGQEPQELATATYNAKIKSNIAPTTYLTMANATGKYLANNIFGRDERKRAEEQYRKSRFLENNLALTSPDTQFDPRLRGFDRTTDAFAGAPYAGAQVQYSQPLIAMGQRGTEIPISMQEGGVYTLTPEMIKQIIENGGEIEYVDESNNFANPFNQ